MPGPVAEVVLACLDPDPGARPAAAEVAGELELGLFHPGGRARMRRMT